MKSAALEKIAMLDPLADHEQIVFLSSRFDFPFDMTRALEFALFRTFAVPSIARLLDRTGEFASRTAKRYDDTDLIVSELMEHGHSSERGRRAIRRMNQLHGRFQIENEDFLYVLSTFVFEPIRWMDRFGWRQMTENERLAFFNFWRETGRLMGITQTPVTYSAFETFNVRFEQENFQYSDANNRVGTSTLRLFCSWFPVPLRPMVRWGMLAVMDEPLLSAMGFPRPPGIFRQLVLASLWLRAKFMRFLPRHKKPVMRTEMRHVTYPGGYEIESLGP